MVTLLDYTEMDIIILAGEKMQTIFIDTANEQETMLLGQQLASLLKNNTLILLDGDLGTGKTTFTKGIAKGLGISETVSSPTFTIIKEYEGKYPLYHIDAYRLEYSEEDLGFDEYFENGGITVIEWAQFIEEFLPETFLKISIDYQRETERRFTFEAIGEAYEKVLLKLKEVYDE